MAQCLVGSSRALIGGGRRSAPRDSAPSGASLARHNSTVHHTDMVSTHSQQYITDFGNTTSETGKSPLAMLAKTCETIGLPDTQAKRSPEKKDSISPSDTKKSDSPMPVKRKDGSRSPRTTPKTATSEPSTSTGLPGMPKHPFHPMAGFPPMGFPMPYPGMMPYPHMPFPAFGMPPFGMRCPAAMLGRPCVTPGCTQCTPTSAADAMSANFAAANAAAAAAASFPGMSPFGYPFMQTSSASSMPASYQQMLQQASAAAAMAQQQASAASAAAAKQHTCSWLDGKASTGVCGQQFPTAEELANHVKGAHTTALTTSPVAKSPATPSTPVSSSRYHPYAKPATSTPTSMPSMHPMFGMPPMPFALQAMYAQRLMSSMPQPMGSSLN